MPTRREMILSTAASVLPVDTKIEPVDEPVALLVKFPKNSSTRQIEYLSQQAKEIEDRLKITVILFPDSMEVSTITDSQLKKMQKTGIS